MGANHGCPNNPRTYYICTDAAHTGPDYPGPDRPLML